MHGVDDTSSILEASAISKSYAEVAVLKDVSLKVSAGRVISITGPSGAGKSTLLRCLNALEMPDSGLIVVDGIRIDFTPSPSGLRPASAGETRALRAKVGIVFQSFNLFPHRTVIQNVALAPMVVKGESSETAHGRARELLRKVHLSHLADRYPQQLSGGQQQRVAIARALAMEPKVMLYDEPTSALDPELVDEVLQVIRDLREAITQIVVTHEIRFARDASDEIIFMDSGEIVETGPPEEIVERPKSDRARSFFHRFSTKWS